MTGYKTMPEELTLDCLETKCRYCKGSGIESDPEAVGMECPVCEGTGYETTDLGEVLLTFMKHQREAFRAR